MTRGLIMIAAVAVPWICLAVFIATAVFLPRQIREPGRMRDVQLSLIASPKMNIVASVFLVLGAVVAVALGFVFVQVGYGFGWGFFAVAATKLFIVGFYAYVARQPLVDLDDDDEPSDPLVDRY
jgi:hypothetical protein